MNVVFHLDVLKIWHRREAQTVTYYHLVIIVVNLPLAIAVDLCPMPIMPQALLMHMLRHDAGTLRGAKKN